MSSDAREQDIFEDCLQLSPAEREAFLEQVCAADGRLRDRMRRLLEAHDRADQMGDPKPALRGDDQWIGPYRLIRILGEGGMGVVYEADQNMPVRRKVALKLVRGGLDSAQVIARFEAERQALAVMDHPNIAKVLDAGTGPDGRPYFVMELVEGVSLTTFCDKNRLSLTSRLQLFVTLCEAVQHAHQKGVIHRDLKPSNVIVSEVGQKPVPRVIDFGIAKAVECESEALLTQVGMVLGTPAYMSPEQARTGVDVDTRSDVYSLGVILFELLVGGLPSDPRRVGTPAFLSNLIDPQFEPPLPSEYLSAIGDDARHVASLRDTDRQDLIRELTGDLDWVARKAMDKDRARRYETASALAMDINRYLALQPLVARPPNTAYKARKFIRRHRPMLVAAGVAALALLIGVVGITVGLLQAERARQEAERQAVKARAAENDAALRLRNALLAQATALRRSLSSGRRNQCLRLLAEAAAIRPGEDLRDEAIACTALTDLEMVTEWPQPENSVSLGFDPGFDFYAVGLRGGAIEIRSRMDHRLIRVLEGTGADPWKVLFGPAGKLLAVKYHGSDPAINPRLKVWNLESGTVVLDEADAVIGSAMAFSPDGQSLVIASGRGLVRFDLRNAARLFQIPLSGVTYHCRFSHDGRWVALAQLTGQIQLRVAETGNLVRTYDYGSPAYSVDWSQNGQRLIAGYADGRAVVWSVKEGSAIAVLRGHQAEVVRVGFHPNLPLVFTYSWDETTRFWNPETAQEEMVINQQALEFSRSGQYLSCVGHKAFLVLRVVNGDTFRSLYGHQGKGPQCLATSMDPDLFASGGSDGILIWDSRLGRSIKKIDAGEVKDLFFVSKDRDLISCGARGLLRWPDWGKEGPSMPATIHSDPCYYAALDSTKAVLVSFHRGTRVYLRALDGVEEDIVLPGYPGMAHPSVSLRGRLVAAGNWRGDRTLVWDVASGEVIKEMLEAEASVSVEFSPDGTWLATGSTEDYRIWHANSWQELLRIGRPSRFSNLPGHMAFSPNGRLLAVLRDQRSIEIHDPKLKLQIATLSFPDPQSISRIRFTIDSSRLLVSTTANRIHLWNFPPIVQVLERYGIDSELSGYWRAGEDGTPRVSRRYPGR